MELRSDWIIYISLKGHCKDCGARLLSVVQSGQRGKSQNSQLQLPLAGYWGEFVLQEYSPGSLGSSGAWSLGRNNGMQSSRGLFHSALFPSGYSYWKVSVFRFFSY